MSRKKVYVCAPYSGTVEQMIRNRRLTIEHCKFLYDNGYNPIAPQLHYPAFLDEFDPDQRQFGLDCGLEWLRECDAMCVFGTRITDGMLREINYVEEVGLPTAFVTNDDDTEIIFETLQRPRKGVSHSCGSAANVARLLNI